MSNAAPEARLRESLAEATEDFTRTFGVAPVAGSR